LTRAASMITRRDPEQWFQGVVEITAAVHGEASAAALADAAVRLTALGAERRRQAQERLESLLQALDSGEPPDDPALAGLGERLERARELPGRARRARVLDVLRKTIAWPEAPAESAEELARPGARSF